MTSKEQAIRRNEQIALLATIIFAACEVSTLGKTYSAPAISYCVAKALLIINEVDKQS